MARRQLARTHLDHAECRSARADRRAHAVPADPARTGAVARAVCARGRGWHHRRLLWYGRLAYRRARPDAAPHRAGPAATVAEGAPNRLGALGRLALHSGAAASGER